VSTPPPPPPQPPADPSRGRPAHPAGVDDPPFADPVDLRDTSASGSFKVPFTVLDAFLAMLAFFAAQLVTGLVFGVWIAVAGQDAAPPTMLVGVLSQVLSLALVVALLLARGRWSWRVWGPRRPSATMALIGLAAGIGGTIVAYLLNAIMALLFQPQDAVEQQVLQDALTGDAATVLLAVLAAVILAPLVEELVFRGLLFPALRSRVGLWPAALISGLVFTVIHVEIVTSQPLALVGLFTLGVWLAWAYHRSGSLVVPIVAHAVFNAASLSLAFAAEALDLEEVVAVGRALLGPAVRVLGG
jgi:membrane protease YdiL (CAAX protease family)